ncbi:MAG: diaminopimelate epimerase [Kineosporiaceae bacterium]
MNLRFVKGHGTENDFVLLPDPERAIDLTPRLVAALCDRRAGIGGDGVLRVVLAATDPEGAPMSDEARWFMDYRNADGSAVEMCGNGIRVFARYLVDAGLAPPGEVAIATRDGVKRVRLGATGDVTVDMGPARFPGPDGIKVTADGRSWPATSVDMGNPHAVAFVDDLADAGPLRGAPAVDPAFPHGVNVEFVVGRGDHHIAMRVHERGVGETRSCGTGACAAMVAAARRAGETGPASYVVDVPGGRLTVTERADGHLELTGPAVLVGEGELRTDWMEAYR